MESVDSLFPEQRSAVEELVSAAQAVDHVDPLNEEAQFLLRTSGARHFLLSGGDPTQLLGYAQWQPANATGQLVVHPDHRRTGVGTRLLRLLRTSVDRVSLWAFHDLPAAQGFAQATGMRPSRGLLVLTKDLAEDLTVTVPEQITLRSFTDADAEAFLATNAAAFAGHPEQGHFSAVDLANRQAEPWWDPQGLILALDSDGVAGFHWAKRHPDGTAEVYVLGVHPRAAGQGLGRTLLDAGLAYLTEHGAQRVILYVDSGNTTAVRLYQRGGFSELSRDTLYSDNQASAPRPAERASDDR
ncbi:MAG: mycothiol synthase [Propioniciclava sp.]